MSDALLELRDVRKAYGGVVAVDGISGTLSSGEFLSFLGPSGSGKTTTLAMIAGLVEPTVGSILLKGRPLNPLPPYRRNIGVVFQNYALFPHMTATKNVAFPLEMRRIPRAEIEQRVAKVLALVGLAAHGNRLPNQLSGGQQQRVALARAMVFEPPLLLMDEPLGALDRKLRAHMQAELKRIQRHVHVTVIYVTHDQEEALTMSDGVAVMRDGRVEQVGPPAELYERPVSPFVADFVGESNFIGGTVVAAVDGRARVRTDGGFEFWGTPIAAVAAGQRVTAAIRPEKLLTDEAATADLNRGRGVVGEVVYVGDATRYRVDVATAGTLTVKIQNRLASRPFAVGDPVELVWDPRQTRLFQDRR